METVFFLPFALRLTELFVLLRTFFPESVFVASLSCSMADMFFSFQSFFMLIKSMAKLNIFFLCKSFAFFTHHSLLIPHYHYLHTPQNLPFPGGLHFRR
jgi:hypothetical protein